MLTGVAAISAAILMTELALTRIFSVTMYYHFAFLAISIALFGLSASAIAVYLLRDRLAHIGTRELLTRAALLDAVVTILALACLVRIRVGLNYSPSNLLLMLAVYLLAALPFFGGGAVISLAFTRRSDRINVLYSADLLGAAAGCLALIPLLDNVGAPGVVLSAAALVLTAAVCFAPLRRPLIAAASAAVLGLAVVVHVTGVLPFDVVDTKGHEGDRVLFSKWNSFSRVAVYDREHGDWSLSPKFSGRRGESLFMDIDSAASTPILKSTGDPAQSSYLRYELTALAYHLVDRPGGFTALVIGPGGGRDLLSALLFGARRIDAVEINPIIARDVMLDRFRDYSGAIYTHPGVALHVEDGRSFVRRSSSRYDVIQASLVDTWAATAAGAYTLTENSLYTSEAFGEYVDHLSEDGVLTITRWVFDGLRLVSLAQAAAEARGWKAADHLAVVRHDRVATFLLRKRPFTTAESARLQQIAADLGFEVLYAPGVTPADVSPSPDEMMRTRTGVEDYRRLILAPDRQQFLDAYPLDVSATTDDRPFFFHTTRLRDQLDVAFGRSMLFGNGLSALLTLMGISFTLVLLFVAGPLVIRGVPAAPGWGAWLVYFASLGAGFMLLEVALLQRFVLLLGHPVYSLTTTLFSLLVGTGIGSYASRRVPEQRVARVALSVLAAVVAVAFLSAAALPTAIDRAIGWPLAVRLASACVVMIGAGVLLGVPLPAGMRLISAVQPALVPWAWGLNGALSVVGAVLAVFIAMNWGFFVTLSISALTYGLAWLVLYATSRSIRAT